MQEQPFYIGQKVVRISNFVSPLKKGVIYTVSGIDKCCGEWYISLLELKKDIKIWTCCGCGKNIPSLSTTKNAGGYAKFFAPVHEGFESISFTKVLEEELVSVN